METSDHEEDSISGENSSEEGSSTSGATGHESSGSDNVKFVQKESRQVLHLKLVVLLILMLAAISLCTLIYFIAGNSEKHSFEDNYEAAADKVIGT